MKKVSIILCFVFMPQWVFSQGLSYQVVKDTIFARPFLHSYIPLNSAGSLNGQPVIPPDFYTRHFGFFCRQELKMQQEHIPVSFRLGSMDYCNWLEQKP